VASSSSDGTVRVWGLKRSRLVGSGGSVGNGSHELHGHEVLEIRVAATVDVFALAWSPDGAWLAGGGSDDQVHIWDAHTGR